jgi:hypothetical protein
MACSSSAPQDSVMLPMGPGSQEQKPYPIIAPPPDFPAIVALTVKGTSSSEDEDEAPAKDILMDEARGMAAVNELLEKYTTLFEQAA